MGKEINGKPLQGSAVFANDGELRLRLDRWWAEGRRALILGCNPSDAGWPRNDPTIHRVIALTRNRFAGFTMVNKTQYIASSPEDMRTWEREMMWKNLDEFIRIERANLDLIRQLSADASIRIVAWGNLVPPETSHATLAAISIDGRHPLYAFGITKSGAPKHPLARGRSHIAEDAPITLWRAAKKI